MTAWETTAAWFLERPSVIIPADGAQGYVIVKL